MSTSSIVNPGLVNVADQAQFPVAVNQAVVTGPSTNPGSMIQAAGQGSRPVAVEQPVRVGPSTNPGAVVQGAEYAPGLGITGPAGSVTPAMTSGGTVQGGSASQVSPSVVSTNQNTVIGQQYGSGTPANVYV